MLEQPQGRLFKLTLSVEEEGGLYFATSKDQPDVFIAVKSRDELHRAIDTCLKNAYGQSGECVTVYMNCQLSGPSVDAVVEIS